MAEARPTVARDEAVFAFLAEHNEHGTTRDQVYEMLHASDPDISPGQAYLCLNRLHAPDANRVTKRLRKGITYWYANV